MIPKGVEKAADDICTGLALNHHYVREFKKDFEKSVLNHVPVEKMLELCDIIISDCPEDARGCTYDWLAREIKAALEVK
jgi:hypothetical protein